MSMHPDYPTPEERERDDAAREDAADALRERLQEERDEMEREWICEKITASRKMIAHGDSFIRHLGLAISWGADVDAKRIKAAFPEYWTEYLDR